MAGRFKYALLLALPALLSGAIETSVSLTSSPNPSIYGHPATLTATVSVFTATGSVTFYDGVIALGTIPVSAGAASLSTLLLPSPGIQSLRARYNGDSSYAASTSAVLSQTVEAVPGSGFSAPLSFAVGNGPSSVAVGDFNGDSVADLAVVNNLDGTVTSLSGQGNGTFVLVGTYTAGSGARGVAVGDFNGDGHADLAVANTGGNVSVLLGNGDGTFSTAVNYPAGAQPYAVAVADFNQDGLADLAVIDSGSNTVSVLLGNGDGSFQAAKSYAAGNQPLGIAVGDVNEDGLVDLAIANLTGGTVSVLLGNGDGTFQTPRTYTTGSQTDAVAIGDLNGDGKPDLAVAAGGDAAVLLGNGDGTFGTPVTYHTGIEPYSVSLADFNGDGIPDLALANYGGSVNYLLGNGDGTFQSVQVLIAGSNPDYLAVGDFNGDGVADIAAVNYNSANVSVFLGTPAVLPDLQISNTHGGDFNLQTGGNWTITVKNAGIASTSGTVTMTDALPSGATATSLSGSGWACTLGTLTCTRGDALAAGASYATITLSVNLTGSAASVTSTATVSGGGEINNTNDTARDTAPVDIPDLTIVKSHAGSGFASGQPGIWNLIVANAGTGATFGTVTAIDTLPSGVTASSIRGSGWTCTLATLTCTRGDALAAGGAYPGIAVTVNVTGGPSSVTNSAAISGGGEINTANDTATDTAPIITFETLSLATSPSGTSVFGSPVTLTATVSSSAATGRVTFYDGTTVLGTTSVSAGIATLATSLLPTGKNQPLRAYYSGDSTYAPGSAVVPMTVNSVPGSGFTGPVNYGTRGAGSGSGPQQSALGDFNGDGKADLVTVNSDGTASVLLGNGDGSFRPAVTYAVGGNGPSSVVVADFNGDGKPDFAVTNFGSVVILLGNGDGTFQAAVDYPAGELPFRVVAGDLNLDGTVDLAVLNLNISNGAVTVAVLLGNGNGTFQAPIAYATPGTFNAGSGLAGLLATGDVNGDGVPDLALATDGLVILLGNGDGTFQTPQSYSLGSGSGFAGLAIADLNGDGKADAALAANGSVVILLGNGDGSFGAPSAFSAPTTANDDSGIALGDFNGDGVPDLAVSDREYNKAYVFLGNGDGTFQPAQTYNAGFLASSIVVGDFNGDGRADMAVTDFDQNAVSVLLGYNGLLISKTHASDFNLQTGGTWNITVTSPQTVGASGQVSVTDSLPSGVTASSISGSGWVCTLGTLTCSRSDALAASTSYAPIAVAVTLTGTPTSVTNSATVSGGGMPQTATATDTAPVDYPDLTIGKTHTGSGFTRGQSGTWTLTVTNTGAVATTGAVNVTDNLPAGLTATSIAGAGWTCTLATLSCSRIDSLAAGASFAGIAVTATVGSGVPSSVTNSAAVSGGGELNTANDTASDTVPILTPVTMSLATNPVGTAVFGSLVTLTATITSPGATGRVTFYDGTTVLGTSSVSAGTATLTTSLLPAGKNQSLRAFYSGDSAYAPGSTSVILTVSAAEGFGFASAVNYGAGTYPNSVALGDFNGDGKIDAIVANLFGGNLSVLLGNGDGTFRNATSTIFAETAAQVVVGDFNGDGKLDLVVANRNDNSVDILFGNGDGTFTVADTYSAGTGLGSISVGDFNGDGNADIVVTNSNSGTVSVLLGNGIGGMQGPTSYSTGSTPQSVAVGDFNGDGIPDLATANNGDGTVSVLLGNGDGTFQAATSYGVGTGPTSITAGDLNGDGKADLTVALSGSVGILLGNGNGTFGTVRSYPAGTAPDSVTLADFNGDGIPDLALADSGGGVNVLQGNGDGSFQTAKVYIAGSSPRFAAVGDFNGDGIADMAVANYSSGNMSVLLGLRTPVAATTLSLNVSLSNTSPPLQLNGVALYGSVVTLTASLSSTVSTAGAGGSVTFYDGINLLGTVALNNGQAVLNTSLLTAGVHSLSAIYAGSSAYTGSFGTSTSPSVSLTVQSIPGGGPLSHPGPYATGNYPFYVMVQDFDHDGIADLAVVNSDSTQNAQATGSVSVLLGNGDGTFKSSVNYGVGVDPMTAAYADVNGDGIPDLIVANTALESNNQLSVLLGKGDGTFQSAVSRTVNPLGFSTAAALSIVAGDFNRDGKTDLAVGDPSSGYAYVLLGTGDSNLFQTAVPYAAGGQPQQLAIADLNGDGVPDLVMVNANSSMGVLLGKGDGTFGDLVTYNTGLVSPDSLSVGDFNGDGRLDVAVANGGTQAQNYSDAGVQIFLGSGTGGGLEPGNSYKVYGPNSLGKNSVPLTITTGDLNGDGKLDLVVGLLGGSGFGSLTPAVYVMFGNGDGTFADSADNDMYTVNGLDPVSVAVADFNGDGTPDIATALYDQANVEIILRGRGSFIDLTPSLSEPAQLNVGQNFNISIGVTSVGTATTNSSVTVFDTLPNGLNATAISGSGWTCTLSSVQCTRSDALAAGASYPPINITVNVSPEVNRTTLVNTVDLQGGGDQYVADNQAIGTMQLVVPYLTITATHTGDFAPGENGARLQMTVANAGLGPTTGLVQVGAIVSGYLTPSALGGTGWTCTYLAGGVGCLRSDTLAAGASYPPITMVASVASNLPNTVTSLTNQAGVSGGGELTNAPLVTDTIPLLTGAALTLHSSANPAVLGQAISITATVTSGATGSVTFYDGVNVLGSAPVSGGHATLTTTLLPTGARSLAAHYSGDGNFGPNTSAVYAETVAALPSSGFQTAVPYAAGGSPNLVTLADFNGDGKTDMAVGHTSSTGIDVLLGNGDGTFQTAKNTEALTGPATLAAGDFDKDGKADLVVANSGNNNVSIFVGNGDGTFARPVNYPAGIEPNSVVVADFNGDGNADLAVSNAGDGTVSVLLGNGDGTFQSQITTAVGTQPTWLTAADFNGDGVLDLAVVNSVSGNIGILLGNGDGTFQTQVTYAAGPGPDSIVAGDLNGDGKPDLAVADITSYNLTVLLGNGDGTFKSAVSYAAPPMPLAVAMGDINGDGRMDVVLDNGGVYLGNGDGTLQPVLDNSTGTNVRGIAVGDFNGDGRSDIAVASNNTGNVNVLLGTALYPDLTISKTHTGTFVNGQSGTFALTVSNVTAAPATATVSVTDTLPAGMTATAMSGSGWTCILTPTLGCTRNDPLPGNSSYAAITLTVSVAANVTAPGSLTNTAAVSGGGEVNTSNDSASDTVSIIATTSLALTGAANPIVGQFDTLTATITPASASGTITFYDGITLLGTAPLSAGQATLKIAALAFGPHSLRAIYPGATGYLPSSATLSETITAVSSNALGGASTFATDTGPGFVASGDFNSDGVADLAVTNAGGNSISVLIGKGDGTFQPAVNYPAGGVEPEGIAVADLNGDGIPDLAVANVSGNQVSILLGKGDGTFQNATQVSSGQAPFAVVAGDFNRDGLMDLAFTNSSTGNVSVLLGSGGGSFNAAVTYPVVTSNLFFIAMADVNGDGIADLVTTSAVQSGNGVGVLIGNGDGTFQPAVSYAAGSLPGFIAVGDFNKDGKPDLAVVLNVALLEPPVTTGNVAVLINKGDGTFLPPVTYTADAPVSIAAGDIDGDGNADLAVANSNGKIGVLLGNGVGTFGTAIDFPAGKSLAGIVAADFNGDGRTDLAAADTGNNDVAILLGQTIASTTSVLGATSPTTITYGQTVSLTLTVTAAGFDSPTGAATLITGGQTIATSSQTTTPYALVTPQLFAGSFTLTAAYGGDARNGPSTSTNSIVIQVNKASQTITFNQPPAHAYGDAPFIPNATASSGLPVSFTSNSAPVCTAAGPTVTIVGAGTCSITANQGGNNNYLAAAITVTQTFNVAMEAQTITFNQPPSHTYGDAPFGITATASSGLLVTLTSNSTTVCTVASFTVTIVSAGACSITATQAGNANVSAATAVPQTFTVNPAPSTIGFAPLSNQVFGIAPFAIAAHANSNPPFPVQFSSQTIGNCSVLNSLVTIRQPGPCTLTATQKGSGNFTAPPVTQSFTINLNPSGTLAGAAASPFAAGNTPLATVVADFNGDGKPDMAIANNGDNTVTVLLGDGTGGFTPVTGSPFAVGTAPVALVAADLNGDGIPDLAAANNGSGNVTVLFGDGAGGFTTDTSGPFATGTGPAAIVTGDFDGDGRPDLAVANFGSGNVTVLMNRPPGFSSASFTAGNGPQSLGVADFNSDGNIDIAVASFRDGKVRLLSGDGTGSFSTGAPLSVGAPAYALAVGDFDGDNKQDLAIASTSGSVAVMLNGASGFTSSTLFTVPNAPFALVTGDFNGDGNRDVAVLTDAANPLTVLLGDGNGNLAAASAPAFPAGAAPNMLAVGDFNGDGRSDLAIPDQGNNDVIVLLGASATTSSILSTTSPATVAAGATVPLTLTLSDTGTAFASPTGTVTFMDNGKAIGTAAQSTSPFTFTTAGLSAGSHTFTASYGSDTRSAASASNTIVIHVPAAVTNVTSTTANGTYGAGTNIGIVETFSEAVTVTGTPRLALNSGGSASYSSGSGTAALTFVYTVGAGQSSSRLDEASTAALTLNGGTILDASSVAATLTLSTPGAAGSLGANSNILIDTVAPTVTSYQVLWGSASYNVIGTTRNRLPWQISKIRVVFSKPIAQATAASLTGVTATALSGLGTTTLTWTITPIALGNFPTVLSGAGTTAIKDAAGNALAGGSGFSQNLKVLYGDVNDDGVVNSQDLALVNNATKQPYNILMDLDGDGAITTTDVKLVQSRIGTSLP